MPRRYDARCRRRDTTCEVFERIIVSEAIPARSSRVVSYARSIPARSSSVVTLATPSPRGLRAQSSAVPSGAEGKQAGDEGWKLKTRTSSLREARPPEVPERSRRAEGATRVEAQHPRTLHLARSAYTTRRHIHITPLIVYAPDSANLSSNENTFINHSRAVT